MSLKGDIWHSHLRIGNKLLEYACLFSRIDIRFEMWTIYTSLLDFCLLHDGTDVLFDLMIVLPFSIR